MDWFQPNAGSITDISTSCIQCVFLIYLLRLKNKTADCRLIIFIYITALPNQLAIFIIGTMAAPPVTLYGIWFILTGFHVVSVIWCSYRIYQNTYPRESWIITAIWSFLFGAACYLWLKDYFHHYATRIHAFFIDILYTSATLLATINYLRKVKHFIHTKNHSSFLKELIHPSSKEIFLFRGFAMSVFIYTLVELIVVLIDLNVLSSPLFTLIIYLLSVSITVLVAISYFNYAAEQTSFETKLVGITLFITLTVISMISFILFGADDTPVTISYTKIFVLIIPATTLLIAFFLPLLLRLTILKGLNKIVTGVQQVISGDLSAHVEMEANDEIGRLSQDFNRMTGSLRQRTEQLHNMREAIATDFHDQTGNMLSAITRQAGLLKLKLGREHELQPMIKSIVDNSNSLYASSKDFLWHLNHNSDDPNELFDYLTSYGQQYYNQFDIAFSARAKNICPGKFDTSSALNLIFIFKEAMTNVAKHAGATEVTLYMHQPGTEVIYTLEDNGSWKESDNEKEHYGLANMKRRCSKCGFGFTLGRNPEGTRVSISIPVNSLINQL